MKYELLLQSEGPGVPYDPAPVEAAFAARGVTLGTGSATWKLEGGEVEVRPLVEGGKLIGHELKVPLSDKLDLVRALVVEGAGLASEAKVRLFDPQLTKNIGTADEGLVADQFLRTARYAGEMLGVPEAIGASYGDPDDVGGLKPGTKVMLGLIGFLVLLYFIFDKLLG